MSNSTSFYAYASADRETSITITEAVEKYNRDIGNTNVLETWEQNEISGVPLVQPIFHKIEEGDFLVADITLINENVTFEIGYALGKKKKCLITKYANKMGDAHLADRIGIFDTLGYKSYSNSPQLCKFLLEANKTNFLDFNKRKNSQQPVYIVEPKNKSDAFLRLVSRIKKARWKYRSFNPDEDVRLSAIDAINNVAESAGVATQLLANDVPNAKEHNIRAMFVAGLAYALEIPVLIIHDASYSPPLDVRDLTKKYKFPDDIDEHVQEFSLQTNGYNQKTEKFSESSLSILETLSIGDPTAENEMTTLSRYYLPTDQFRRADRGEVNLVVGRKGSGKTALFVQLRNKKRTNKNNIVVDLKPEGYQLLKLKERVLIYLTEGAQQHLITAFWYYILLLEISYKVLEKDQINHFRDSKLTEKYDSLKKLYESTELSLTGDFRERLASLSNELIQEFRKNRGDDESVSSLKLNEVTELIYKHDIKQLKKVLIDYLALKGETWLLFDNIDKGWSVEGVSHEDIYVLRCLIDASRKLEREFRSKDLKFNSITFIRGDVYELLMEGSADYGKDMRANLDWNDSELLGLILKYRIVNSLRDKVVSGSASEVINQIAISHYDGVPTIEYFIERSLMRPRNLIKLFKHCLGNAVSLRSDKILEDHIEKGLETYSQDILIEVDREMTDVFPDSKRLIYEFVEESKEFSESDLRTLIEISGMKKENLDKAISFLIYYGVLGIKKSGQSEIYIQDVNYDIEMIKVKIRKWSETTKYVVSPALWPALKL